MKWLDLGWIGAAALAALLGGCGGGSTALPPTPECSLDSDCTNPLRCVQGFCVNACNESRDCPSDERCIKVTIGAATSNSCQPFEKAMCHLNSDCTVPLICAIDLQCRNQCNLASVDCPMGQVCTTQTHLCVDPTLDTNYDPVTNELKVPDAGAGGHDGGVTDGGSDVPVGVTPTDGGLDSPIGVTPTDGGPDSPIGVTPLDGGLDGGAGGTSGGGPVTACGDGGAGTGLAGFHPSNLPAQLILPVGIGDYVESSGDNCSYDTDTLATTCTSAPPDGGFAAQWVTDVMPLGDGREVVVAFFSSYLLPSGKTLSIGGKRPLIIATTGGIEIDGTIVNYSAVTTGWWGGGAPGPSSKQLIGICPLGDPTTVGGGSPGGAVYTDGLGSGGGGFCGVGGSGTIPAPTDGGPTGLDGGVVATGGSGYGTPQLIPLVGGSSGGSAGAFSVYNHGGGALELVAGTTLVIGASGVINLGGGADNTNFGLGGGSGGAILLEAPAITVDGILTVNGGSGNNSGGAGHPGMASAQPAIADNNLGGAGSASGSINGTDGITSNSASGGGGAAGRIRLNTCAGALKFGAPIISPSTTTKCFTTGSLQ
jgi:hypothetical protein